MSLKETDTRPIAWSDMYALGYGPMDEIHQEFIDIVAKLQTVDNAQLNDFLSKLRAHAESHFAQENEWMLTTDFPPRKCHIEQHEAVLESIIEVQALTADGNFQICRDLANELATWFPGHADYLDAPLAQWLCKRLHGGVPIVIRRRPAVEST